MRTGTLLLLLAALLLGGCQVIAPPPPMVGGASAPAYGSPSVFVTGAALHNANGIHFGPDGNLYIASVTGREIVVMDPESGAILERLGPEQGIEGPDDLAFGPDGALYWTSFFTGEVGKLSPSGEKSTAGQLTLGVNPVTVSDDGRVFAALCLAGDALYELDPNGATEPRLIAENVGNGCASNGMDWGPDGMLYNPRWFQGQVVRTNVETGAAETVADGISVPASVKFDSQGRLHAVNALTGEVLRIDIDTGATEVIAVLEPGLDSLAFDAGDRLYVSSFSEGSITEVLTDGSTRTVSPGGLAAPGGLAVHGDSLFVADILSLKELDIHSGAQTSIQRDVIGFSPLGAPFTVSSADETLLISSWFGNVVQVWDPAQGEVTANITGLAAPMNAIDFQGAIAIAELGTGSVVLVDAADPEQRTVLAAGLAVPVGLAAAGGNLWVSDWATGSVVQIAADGAALAEPVPVASGLQGPEGMAVAGDGRLLVVETGSRSLLAIDPQSGTVTTIASDLAVGMPAIPGFPPTWVFNGVAVAADGAIFVAGDVENTIYRIAPGG